MKRFAYFLTMFAMAGLFACQNEKTESNGNTDFVTTRDGKFYRGAEEYKFIGANFWFGAILASEGQGGDRERLAKELDLMQEVGITNVRVLVGGEGPDTVASHVVPVLHDGCPLPQQLLGMEWRLWCLPRMGRLRTCA